jgi:hypothetical protein
MTHNQYIINRLLHFGMFVWLLLFSRRGWKIWTPITYHRKQLPQRLKVKVYHLQNVLLLPSLTHIHSGASCKRSMVAWDIWLTYFETWDTVSQLGRQRSALFGKRKKTPVSYDNYDVSCGFIHVLHLCKYPSHPKSQVQRPWDHQAACQTSLSQSLSPKGTCEI